MSTTLIAGEAIPFPVSQGGTGAATLTGLLMGNGTSAVTAIGSTTVGATGWTPTIALATPGSSSFGTLAGNGRYSILGNICYFTAQLSWASFTVGSGSGAVQLSLPVASGAFAWAGQGIASGTGISTSITTAFGGYELVIGSGVSVATINCMGAIASTPTNATLTVGTNATVVNGSETFNYSGWYFVS